MVVTNVTPRILSDDCVVSELSPVEETRKYCKSNTDFPLSLYCDTHRKVSHVPVNVVGDDEQMGTEQGGEPSPAAIHHAPSHNLVVGRKPDGENTVMQL